MDPKAKDKAKIRQALNEMPPNPREINKVVARVLSNLSENLVITEFPKMKISLKGLVSLFENPEFREFGEAFQLARFLKSLRACFSSLSGNFQHIGRSTWRSCTDYDW